MIFETGPFENRNYTKRADVNTLRILGCFVAIMPRKDSWGGIMADGYPLSPGWM
jgi:hypothetical protein